MKYVLFACNLKRKCTIQILGGKCIAVPNSDDILEIFGFGYPAAYGSPPGSSKDSPDHDMKPIVQVLTGKYISI